MVVLSRLVAAVPTSVLPLSFPLLLPDGGASSKKEETAPWGATKHKMNDAPLEAADDEFFITAVVASERSRAGFQLLRAPVLNRC
jgi:hypothetical protein